MKIWDEINNFSARNPVVTIGIFDGLHTGHRYLLDHLKKTAEKANGETVVLTLWPHPRVVLNNDPVNLRYLTSLEEKIRLFREYDIDHLIIIPFTKQFSELGSCEFVKTILVDTIKLRFLLIGYNHKFGINQEGNYESLSQCAKSYGFSIQRVDPVSYDGVKISSSIIRELLNSDELDQANRYLGYDYFLEGKVTGGNRIGRKIGFPTANVLPSDPHKLIPRDGVYAVHIDVEGRILEGMLNIGYRPTIETGMPIKTIEVNLFDFKGDIYYKKVTIYFRKRMRNEKKFEGIEQLREQLVRDQAEARRILKELRK